MTTVVILAVAAVWAAVILPPLLRSRVESRPNASVTDFRRQLSTLQRAVPTRTMVPMRGMARPLAQAPQQRSAAYGNPYGNSYGAPRGLAGHPGQVRRAPAQAPVRERMQDASMRRNHTDRNQVDRNHSDRNQADDTSTTRSHRTTHMHKVSQREIVRRRRSNIVMALVTTVALSGFLAATTHSSGLIYLFALSFVSLCGYCYKLVQIRNLETDRTYSDQAWFHAV